jgi:hypothetical protein
MCLLLTPSASTLDSGVSAVAFETVTVLGNTVEYIKHIETLSNFNETHEATVSLNIHRRALHGQTHLTNFIELSPS